MTITKNALQTAQDITEPPALAGLTRVEPTRRGSQQSCTLDAATAAAQGRQAACATLCRPSPLFHLVRTRQKALDPSPVFQVQPAVPHTLLALTLAHHTHLHVPTRMHAHHSCIHPPHATAARTSCAHRPHTTAACKSCTHQPTQQGAQERQRARNAAEAAPQQPQQQVYRQLGCSRCPLVRDVRSHKEEHTQPHP